jgi:zinc/manganese transport system permease protein
MGVLIVSVSGGRVDLLHLLFGTVLAVDDDGLILVAATSTVVLFTLALIYRPLILDCLDRRYLALVGVSGMAVHVAFVVLVVLNLVAGFQVLGTLMSVGMLVLPAAAARFWTTRLDSLFAVTLGFGLCASVGGLLLSYHLDVPSGPAIVLVAGSLYLVSVLGGRYDSIVFTRLARRRRLA